VGPGRLKGGGQKTNTNSGQADLLSFSKIKEMMLVYFLLNTNHPIYFAPTHNSQQQIQNTKQPMLMAYSSKKGRRKICAL